MRRISAKVVSILILLGFYLTSPLGLAEEAQGICQIDSRLQGKIDREEAKDELLNFCKKGDVLNFRERQFGIKWSIATILRLCDFETIRVFDAAEGVAVCIYAGQIAPYKKD